MDRKSAETLRKYGYDILINRFEPLLRKVIINEVLLLNYGAKLWSKYIPKGVKTFLKEEKDLEPQDTEIEDYFDELYLLHLKEIAIFDKNYQYLNNLIGLISKEKFVKAFDELNAIRVKIAHAKSTFTQLDLSSLTEIIKTLCSNDLGHSLLSYIQNEQYKSAMEIPLDFFAEAEIPTNLPKEEYDLDGGFVGRAKERVHIKKLLYSNQDRIITITGAGGVGKSAVALKSAYDILADQGRIYEAIIWFSAKETKLTSDNGVVEIEPEIRNSEQLVKDILRIIDPQASDLFGKDNMEYKQYVDHLYSVFSSQHCLIIIDNLETIKDQETINFIKDIPRPSQTLITSRKGLGEIERRYPLPELSEKDAIKLFRLIAREKNRKDLLKLDNENIQTLVKKVKNYPLLIKWSVGKVCLGMDINQAFSEIYSGKSEIAEFAFNDVFELITDDARLCLYSMIVFGDKPVSKHMLIHLTSMDVDKIEDALRELIICSFVYPEVSSSEDGLTTEYSMLSLTRGFIAGKLDADQMLLNMLQTKYYELSVQVEQLEKSRKDYYQSLFSLGIKSETDKVAFNYVKTAKNFAKSENYDEAERNFASAIKIAPTLNYVLNEYAKFEFYRGHIQRANELFNQAIKHNPDNFHSYFSYGICLKKQNLLGESIKMLTKAIELNPNYLASYSEVGRVYSFNGDYEKAEEMFGKAKDRSPTINFRHEFLRMQFQADNYKRWSEAFFSRNDIDSGLQKLHEALSASEKVNQFKPNDKKAMIHKKKIHRELAYNYSKIGDFEKAIPNFEKCFSPIILEDGSQLEYDPEMVMGYYHYAYFGFKKKRVPIQEVKNAIRNGLHIARNQSLIKRFMELDREVSKRKKALDQKSTFFKGIIQWFNFRKGYGIVRSGENTFLFFLSGFRNKVDPEQIENLEGKKVSFSLTKNPLRSKQNENIATKIEFEEYV